MLKKIGFIVCCMMVRAYADGPLRSVIVFGNDKTDRETILNMIRLSERGEYVDRQLIKEIDDRLVNSNLFKSVHVRMINNPNGTADIRITVSEKTLWFVFPIFQTWSGQYNFGAAFGESNLLFPGTQTFFMLQGGTNTNRAFYAFDTKNVWQTDLSLRIWLLGKRDKVPLYTGQTQDGTILIHEGSFSVVPGFQWTNEIRTSFVSTVRRIDYGTEARITESNVAANDISFGFEFLYDSFKRREGFLRGTLLKAKYEFAQPQFGADFTYNAEEVEVSHARLLGKYFNYSLFVKGALSNNMPFHREFTLGGTNLRGFLDRQFRGDTLIMVKNDLLFRLLKTKKFSVFGDMFHDSGLLFFDRNGLSRNAWNNSSGAGIRLSLSDILAPVFGFDFAYGYENKAYEFLFALGLVSF